jgi:hypothetical protein
MTKDTCLVSGPYAHYGLRNRLNASLPSDYAALINMSYSGSNHDAASANGTSNSSMSTGSNSADSSDGGLGSGGLGWWWSRWWANTQSKQVMTCATHPLNTPSNDLSPSR